MVLMTVQKCLQRSNREGDSEANVKDLGVLMNYMEEET